MTVTAVRANTWKEFHTARAGARRRPPGRQARRIRLGPAADRQQMDRRRWSPRPADVDEARRPAEPAAPRRHARLLRCDGRAPRRGPRVPPSDDDDAPRVVRRQPGAGAPVFPWRQSDRQAAALRRRRERGRSRSSASSRTRGPRRSASWPSPRSICRSGRAGAFSKHLVLRATGDPRSLAALVRRELRAVDPTAAVEHVTTMAEIRRESLAPRTFAMRLLTGFAVLATPLALVGLYGVLSLSVGSRIKEIAVRKAVGAQRQRDPAADSRRRFPADRGRRGAGRRRGGPIRPRARSAPVRSEARRSVVAPNGCPALRHGSARRLPGARDSRRPDRSADGAASRIAGSRCRRSDGEDGVDRRGRSHRIS